MSPQVAARISFSIDPVMSSVGCAAFCQPCRWLSGFTNFPSNPKRTLHSPVAALRAMSSEKSAVGIRLVRPSLAALQAWRGAVPDLGDNSLYKGARGKVVIIGGSTDYTGAPFYSAMASLRGGGELATVYCAAEAATAIKSYSPDIIVKPNLGAFSNPTAAREALSTAHTVALGPGLGRCELAGVVVRNVIKACVTDAFLTKDNSAGPFALVLDADSLWFLGQDCDLLHLLHESLHSPQRSACIYLTPNAIEFGRLLDAWGVSSAEHLYAFLNSPPAKMYSDDGGQVKSASSQPGKLVIVRKGAVDRIDAFGPRSDGKELVVDNDGSRKRCGGQGDVLAGLLALFAGWAGQAKDLDDDRFAGAAVAASLVTRQASKITYEAKGRSMVASDVLDACGPAFEILGLVK